MSMMVSFVLSFFPRDVLDEILNLIESVSEDFPSYSCQENRKIWLRICIFLFVYFLCVGIPILKIVLPHDCKWVTSDVIL